MGRLGAVMLAGLMLGGCAAVPGFGPAPVDAYDVGVPALSEGGRRLPYRQVLVPEPSALKVLDGQNIVIRGRDGSVQYLGGARWSDRLPKVVQERLIEAYQESERLGGVGRPGEGLAIDYQVIVDLRAFEVRVNGGDHAYVELFARVLNDRNGVVRASRDFSATVPVGGKGTADFIAALDRAFRAAAADIVDWSISVM